MINNNWFFQTLKSEALEGTRLNVAYRSERSSTMFLSTGPLWLVKFWSMRSRTNSSSSSSKPFPQSFDGNPSPPDPASAGKERGFSKKTRRRKRKRHCRAIMALSLIDMNLEHLQPLTYEPKEFAKLPSWTAIALKRPEEVEHQTWLDQLFERRFVQPNSFPYLDSVDEGTSSELEIHPKQNGGSRPNPSAGGFHPSVVKFSPLCGLTCWRSIQLFDPSRVSERFEVPTEREHWRLLNLIDGSDFEILDLIAEGSQQHQVTLEYVNRPGCTHLGLSLPTHWFCSSDSWTTLLASETMLAKSMGSTPTFTGWVRWSWYWTVCEGWIRASNWPL